MTAAVAQSYDAPEELDSAWSAWSRSVDHISIFICLILFFIGVILAFAASPDLARDNGLPPFYYAWRHMMFGVPAFLALICLSFLNAKCVRRGGMLIALAGFTALALLPAYGEDYGKGALRWFSVAGVSIQPSELLKPGLIVLCAWMLSAMAHQERRIRTVGAATSFATAAIAVGLLLAQPDYGQAALILSVWGAMFFLAGASPWLLMALAAAALGIGAVGYAVEPHVAARIDAFLDPAHGAGRQLQLAEAAIISGGWTGQGLGEGVAKSSVPDAHADLVLAVAAEEYGVLLVLFILALFTALVLRAFWRLADHPDAFVRLAGAGLALLVGVQAFVNFGVTVQLLPTKGMTLPFISYGGTSMLAVGVAMGLLLALTRRAPALEPGERA